MSDITAIILAYNEEKHIERCINNIKNICSEIYVIDSYSNDRTEEVALSLGAKVLKNKWENNYAKQFNWGISNLPKTTDWVLRIDADEYLTDELINEIKVKLGQLDNTITGVLFERKMIFMDQIMTRGMVKMNMLRLFKYKFGKCEERWMDEHIVLTEGNTIQFFNYFVDHNLNSLGWWINKHNGYSIREAIDLLDYEMKLTNNQLSNNLTADARVKRDKKNKYVKLPLFWRAFYYFIYRYFFKLGIFEGKNGFLWHFFQGWWYRTLVDAKVYEIKKHCGNDVFKIKEFIKDNYNIEV